MNNEKVIWDAMKQLMGFVSWELNDALLRQSITNILGEYLQSQDINAHVECSAKNNPPCIIFADDLVIEVFEQIPGSDAVNHYYLSHSMLAEMESSGE